MLVNRLTSLAIVLLVIPLAICASQAGANGLHPLAGIRTAAENGLRRVIDAGLPGVQLEAAALDARLRIPACPGKLESFATLPRPTQSRATVRVSCAAPAWTLNVPVEIRRAHAVLVLRRAVGRGEIIRPEDVSVQHRVLPGLGSPFLASTDQLSGRLTRRPVPEGSAVAADALSAALLIHRGQTVTLVAHSDGFEVRAPGRAMADASAQQRVRVQNLNSLKIVEGLADSNGVVRVLP